MPADKQHSRKSSVFKPDTWREGVVLLAVGKSLGRTLGPPSNCLPSRVIRAKRHPPLGLSFLTSKLRVGAWYPKRWAEAFYKNTKFMGRSLSTGNSCLLNLLLTPGIG